MKKYLFFASLSYSFPILRPLQDEIRRRGGDVVWYLEPTCDNWLRDDEKQLKTIREIIEYNPIAVFAPGNHIYDFLPGVKVQVFHGYAMNKRADNIDDHFTIRGWFDMYCTQGSSSTPYFKELEAKYGYFKIYETGWCKVDPFFDGTPEVARKRPAILYSPTFTRNITSVYDLFDTISGFIKNKPWDWIITFHPKLDDPELIERYKLLADNNDNVTFYRSNDGLPTFRKVDMMLCDSSSIIVEIEMLDKPVVTFRNTMPGPHLLDVRHHEEVEGAIERALTRPPELMAAIRNYTMQHEAHRDGHNSERVLDAVDDFITNYKGNLKRKRPKRIRRLKMRKRTGYWPFIEKWRK